MALETGQTGEIAQAGREDYRPYPQDEPGPLKTIKVS
jgi:hypothetical protein